MMADRTAQAIPGLNYYEAVDAKSVFHNKTSTVSFNGLVLTASALDADYGRRRAQQGFASVRPLRRSKHIDDGAGRC
ncbi:MAG: hypothetical protein WDN31_12975 [Hyphomicrobium sp.]